MFIIEMEKFILSVFSPEVATFLLASTPLLELRASIPIAILVLGLPIWKAILISVIGNVFPAIILLYAYGPLYKYLKKNERINRLFEWVFNRTRRKFNDKHHAWGNLALMMFVAIPLPVTGAWTGATAAWLFGIKKSHAILFITLGVFIAGTITTGLTIGVSSLFNVLRGEV